MVALGEVEDGACLILTLTGNLKEEFDGTAIVGQDVVRIIKKGGNGGHSSTAGGLGNGKGKK